MNESGSTSASQRRGRWRGREVARAIVAVDTGNLVPWGGLRYALGAGAVLVAGSLLAGSTVGVIAASGAINAGSVGVTSGVQRPRLTMSVAALALAATATLGSLTGDHQVANLLCLAAIAFLAGLVADTGPAASTVGVQAMVGFVTLGRFPQPPSAACVTGGIILLGGIIQIALGLLWRAPVLRRALDTLRGRHTPAAARPQRVLRHAPQRLAQSIRDNLRPPDRAARWHAVRLSLALVAAELIALNWAQARGYWIAVTVLNVLKPDWVKTASRGVDRWLGSLVGAVAVGALTAIWHAHGPALLAAVVLPCWAMYTFIRANYALYTMFLASEVVLLLSAVAPALSQTALQRAEFTTVGGLLAITVHAVIRTSAPTPPDNP